jgi:predicted RecA/RadA family phage recombinase
MASTIGLAGETQYISAKLDGNVTLAYVPVALATDGDVDVAGAGTQAIGIVTEIGSAGDTVKIAVSGVTYARISTGSINAGVAVKVAANGYVDAATDGTAVVGWTLASATGVDSLVPIILHVGGSCIANVIV